MYRVFSNSLVATIVRHVNYLREKLLSSRRQLKMNPVTGVSRKVAASDFLTDSH